MKKLTFFAIFVLIGLMTACSSPPPPLGQAQAAENEAASLVEVPAAAPAVQETEPLPPVVLRTSPEPGEEQPVDAPIEIVFDQPMDRNSVEKAFAIEPGASVDGVFEWVDDQTVRFTFNDGFERGERYRVRVIESAQSQAGLALQRPFELRFSTAGFLEVTNVQPADGATEILPDSVVTVVFNRPVVPLGAIENAAGLPDPLTFVPPVAGQGKWLNTSIYQFTPDVGFEAATDYQARVAQGLADAAGNAVLADDFEWTFTTVTPQAIGSIPANGDIYVSPTPVISVTFNQPMDRRSVEQNFILRNENTNEVISGKFAWVEQGISQPIGDEFEGYYEYTYDEGEGPTEIGVETVMFTPDKTLDFNGIYAIVLPQGTAGKIGQAETQADFTATFTVIPYPAIASTYPADGDEQMEPWQSLQVTFNGPMNPDTVVFGQNLVIEPSVAVTQVYTYWWSSNTSLELSFPTEASSQYTVTLGADIEGRYGQQLGKSTRVSWQTRAESPLVYMHSAGRIATYNAYTDTLAFITVRNVGRVQFSLYRLPKDDFLSLNASDGWDAWDRYNPDDDNLISEWELKTTPELDDNVIYRIDLGQRSGLGERLPPGLYYLEASVDPDDIYPQATGPNSYLPSPERKMLVVSKNNITFKTTGSEGLAWLTDLQSGLPVGNMPIDFVTTPYGSSPLDLGQATTAADGVAQTDYSESGDPFEARFAFAGDPDQGDDDFGVTVSNWTDGIDRWQFDNVNVEDYQQPYNAQFYTDRKIYRPGQTVYYKGVIRADDDARYSLPTAFDTVNVLITDSQGKEVFSDDLPVSEFGTVYGSFDLAENAGLGFYSIQILFEENQYFYTDFQVAAYRKPEYLVEVTTDKPEYTQGDKIKVSASAEFFSGGPVSNAKVRWTLLSDDYFFQYQGEGFYDFTDYDFSRQSQGNYFPGFGETIAEGEGVTDANGRFTFEVEADIAAKIASQRFTFDVVITDISNQEVASQAQAVVHKGLVYVGLRPEEYVGQVGRSSLVNVLVVDWDSQPVARQEVQLVFSEHNWYSVQKQYEDGSFYWDSVVEDIPVFTTTVTSAADGQAVADFTPEQGGIYKVAATATDRQGNEVRSSTYMWVSGSEYVNWRQENNDRIDLVADQREYRVGDTATILVPHPYSGTVQALVTLERGHIYDHYVTELPTNSEQLQIPIEEWMIPNMYVSVVVVQGSTPAVNGGVLPSFKVGYASLPINTAEKQLTITLTPSPPLNPPPQEGGGAGGGTSQVILSSTESK